MGMAPEGCMSVAETAASNPDLSVLVEALTAAGLADTEALTNVLTFHVVPDVAAMSSDLTDGQMLPTMEGDDLTVDLSMPDKVAINPGDAEVIIPDIEACMAVIHVIDKVLVPPAAPMP